MKKKGFTLMELMVVVIIVGIIAGFALPQYQRSLRKAHERDAYVQLASIHAANAMYRAVNDEYLPGTNINLAAINTGLNLNVLPNDMTYAYNRATTTTYTASAFWDEAVNANDFILVIDQGTVDNNNPCCHANTAGQCPTVPDC